MKKASNHLCNPNKSANFVANETKKPTYKQHSV